MDKLLQEIEHNICKNFQEHPYKVEILKNLINLLKKERDLLSPPPWSCDDNTKKLFFLNEEFKEIAIIEIKNKIKHFEKILKFQKGYGVNEVVKESLKYLIDLLKDQLYFKINFDIYSLFDVFFIFENFNYF